MATSDPWERIARATDERTWLVPLCLYVIGVATYVLLAGGRVGPIVDNDEYIYGNLAQSLASGDGFTWRGNGVGLPTLYPYVIAPAWLVANGGAAYDIAKGINALLLAAVVWPVWLLARELVGPRLAALPALLVLLGMWMESSARIMTESLALPGATVGLCATVIYLQRGRLSWLILAFAGVGVAMLARPHLVILLPVMGAAVTLDVLRRSRDDWRAAAATLKRGLVLTWGAVAASALVLVLVRSEVVGDYASLADARPGIGEALRWAGDYAADLAVMVGVVPWLVSLALLGSRGAWRDRLMGPFLAVLAPSLVVVILFAGWFCAGVSLRPFDRYVFYLAPLLLIGMTAGLPWVRWRGLALAAAATTLLMGIGHDPQEFGGGAQALFGSAHQLGFISGPGDDFMWRLAGAAAVIGIVISVALWVRSRTETVTFRDVRLRTVSATLVLCSLIAAIGMSLVSRDQWEVANDTATRVASAFGGEPPDRVDGVQSGSKTLVASSMPAAYVLWLEFFNKDIDRVVVKPAPGAERSAGYGIVCPLRIGDDGTFVRGDGCGADNATFVVAALPQEIPTLVAQTRFAGDLDSFGVIYVVSGEPRFVASRPDLCPAPSLACRPSTIRIWNSGASVLEVRFIGGVEPFSVEVAGRVRTLAADQETVIRVPLASGASETLVRTGWPDARPGTPKLKSMRLLPRNGRPIPLN